MKPKVIIGVPEQKKGSFHDTESSRLFESTEITHQNFEILKTRFLAINQWKEFCKEKSADFKLFDSTGNHITRIPKENDLIRIDIPGPGNPESKGYDWVKIIKISNQNLTAGEIESVTITCEPTINPKSDNKHIAHFYSRNSSSTFNIVRGSKYIKIGIYGRNETPNMNTNFTGKIRNLMIAAGGMLGISKMQWKVFANEILKF